MNLIEYYLKDLETNEKYNLIIPSIEVIKDEVIYDSIITKIHSIIITGCISLISVKYDENRLNDVYDINELLIEGVNKFSNNNPFEDFKNILIGKEG